MGNRPRPSAMRLVKKIINEELSKMMIDEVFDKPVKTTYEKLLDVVVGYDHKHDIYRFKTDGGFSYDVEFHKIFINFKHPDFDTIHLLDGSSLPNKHEEIVTVGIIIGFTPTEVSSLDVPEDIEGTPDDPYINRTGRNEQYEVLGKIIYLVEEYIKNNPNLYIYIITKNTNRTNIKIYNQMFRNVFSNNFDVYESSEAYYYIKK
jgi:hypothetical protein